MNFLVSNDAVIVRVVDLEKFLRIGNFLPGQIPRRVRLENKSTNCMCLAERRERENIYVIEENPQVVLCLPILVLVSPHTSHSLQIPDWLHQRHPDH